jgi:hypothetical protein
MVYSGQSVTALWSTSVVLEAELFTSRHRSSMSGGIFCQLIYNGAVIELLIRCQALSISLEFVPSVLAPLST